MVEADRLVDVIMEHIRKEVQQNTQRAVYGTFLSEEPLDNNLSVVLIDNKRYRFVPKYAHVGTLTPGAEVVVTYGGGLLQTITGVHVGDVSLATLEED